MSFLPVVENNDLPSASTFRPDAIARKNFTLTSTHRPRCVFPGANEQRCASNETGFSVVPGVLKE